MTWSNEKPLILLIVLVSITLGCAIGAWWQWDMAVSHFETHHEDYVCDEYGVRGKE